METINNIMQTLTDGEIIAKEYLESEFIIQGILPDGLTILAGKPKIGKSLISLDFALSISTGGRALGAIDVEKKEVLYFTLEDTNRRLKSRIQLMQQNYPPSNCIHFASA